MVTVRIKNDGEYQFLIQLLDEFGPRIIRPRKQKAAENLGHYGIISVTEDVKSDDKLYEVALPEHYVKFFNYLMIQRRKNLLFGKN